MRNLVSVIIFTFIARYVLVVSGRGTLFIHLDRYTNPNGDTLAGSCCDGIRGNCAADPCDMYFDICLDSHFSDDDDITTCAIGNYRTDVTRDVNNIDFGNAIGDDGYGTPNPYYIEFEGAWPGGVTIKMNVWDSDGASQNPDFVDILKQTVYFDADGVEMALDMATSSTRYISLFVTVKAYCDDGWYGPRCDVHCVIDAQYECNIDGVRSCRPGVECEAPVDPCHPSPCLHGECVIHEELACRCDVGWSGSLCDHTEISCADSPCHPSATCVVDATPGVSSGGPEVGASFTCLCHEGRTGQLCHHISPCHSSPCFNDGRCEDTASSTECENMYAVHFNTNEAYAILRCEVWRDQGECDLYDVWMQTFCKQACTGCVTEESVYLCWCAPGWMGPDCGMSQDDCVEHDCLNGATCVDEHQAFRCECPLRWHGDKCESMDLCGGVECSAPAICQPSDEDMVCICGAHPCGSHGVCEASDDEPRCMCNRDVCEGPAECVEDEWKMVDECLCGAAVCDTLSICTSTDHGNECLCDGITCGAGGSCVAGEHGLQCVCGDESCRDNEVCLPTEEGPLCFCHSHGGVCSGDSICTDTDSGALCLCGEYVCQGESVCSNTIAGPQCQCEKWICEGDSVCTHTESGQKCLCGEVTCGGDSICTLTTSVPQCLCGEAECKGDSICFHTSMGPHCLCGDSECAGDSICSHTDSGAHCLCGGSVCEGASVCSNTSAGPQCHCKKGVCGGDSTCTWTVNGHECLCGEMACSGVSICSITRAGPQCRCGEVSPPCEGDLVCTRTSAGLQCLCGEDKCEGKSVCTQTSEGLGCLCGGESCTGASKCVMDGDFGSMCVCGATSCVGASVCVDKLSGPECTCGERACHVPEVCGFKDGQPTCLCGDAHCALPGNCISLSGHDTCMCGEHIGCPPELGKCVPVDHQLQCVCIQGYIGPGCVSITSTPRLPSTKLPECHGKTCQNQGVLTESCTCECPWRMYGESCEHVIPPCSAQAPTEYTCMSNERMFGSRALCWDSKNTLGSDKKASQCVLAAHCACEHGGTCHSAGGGTYCACAAGWLGEACELQEGQHATYMTAHFLGIVSSGDVQRYLKELHHVAAQEMLVLQADISVHSQTYSCVVTDSVAHTAVAVEIFQSGARVPVDMGMLIMQHLEHKLKGTSLEFYLDKLDIYLCKKSPAPVAVLSRALMEEDESIWSGYFIYLVIAATVLALLIMLFSLLFWYRHRYERFSPAMSKPGVLRLDSQQPMLYDLGYQAPLRSPHLPSPLSSSPSSPAPSSPLSSPSSPLSAASQGSPPPVSNRSFFQAPRQEYAPTASLDEIEL